MPTDGYIVFHWLSFWTEFCPYSVFERVFWFCPGRMFLRIHRAASPIGIKVSRKNYFVDTSFPTHMSAPRPFATNTHVKCLGSLLTGRFEHISAGKRYPPTSLGRAALALKIWHRPQTDYPFQTKRSLFGESEADQDLDILGALFRPLIVP